MRYIYPYNGYLFEWGHGGRLNLGILISVIALVGIFGYLMGSINTAVIVSKLLYKDDVRNYGSGNAGMTNMFRVFGKKAGFLTLAGDALKALVAVGVGYFVMGDRGSYIAGFFCLIGHSFPLYFHFKGGKGVIVSAITILFIDPLVFLILILIFALMFFATKIVSASSITAAFFYPVIVYGFHRSAPDLIYISFSLFIGLFVIAMHRENIHRLMNHTEKKVEFGKKKGKGKK